jgi:23S rRNA G2445 N2-methylase RlmL
VSRQFLRKLAGAIGSAHIGVHLRVHFGLRHRMKVGVIAVPVRRIEYRSAMRKSSTKSETLEKITQNQYAMKILEGFPSSQSFVVTDKSGLETSSIAEGIDERNNPSVLKSFGSRANWRHR